MTASPELVPHTATPSAPPTLSDTVPRTGKELIAATRPFAVESRALSWLHTLSTAALVVGASTLAARLSSWPARLAAATLAALAVVRMFILFHDFMHLAILRGSWAAKALFYVFGWLILTPPSVWKETHNYHHAHTAKIVGSHVGSFAMVTTAMWRAMSPGQRRMYRAVRHPLTILLAYGTVFLWGMCLGPLRRAPRKHLDAALSPVLHFSLVAGLTWRFGFATAFFAVVLPLAIATAMGAYLFYAQHNFPGVYVAERTKWTYTDAALRSSSYLELGPIMRYFTGNIGFHHVHHLNAGIPFYRLPEAMAAIPELAHPTKTTLRPRDVWACLRLSLWDADSGALVPYPTNDD